MKAIIFDFDNTLEDFAAVRKIAEKHVATDIKKKYGISAKTFITTFQAIDLEVSHKAAGKKPWMYAREYWFYEFFRLQGRKVSKAELKRLTKLYWNHLNPYAKAMPHVQPVLRKLKKKYKLAVMSDSDGSVRIKYDRIRQCGIFDYFHLIALGDHVDVNKPSKKFYNYIFKRLKIRAKDCVMVGDKPEVDLKLAKQLGMKTIWVKHGAWAKQLKGKKFSYVDHEVTDMRTLLKIL